MYLRRIKILVIVMIAALLGMLGRLGYLQIVQGDYHRQKASELLRYTELVQPVRGRILDRNGKVLAYDKPCMDFCLDYRFITDQERWVKRAQRRIAQDEGISASQAALEYERRAEATWKLAARAAGLTREELQSQVLDPLIRQIERLRERVGMDVREQRQAHAIVRAVAAPEFIERAIDSRATVGASLRQSGMRWYPQGSAACHIIGLTGEVSSEDINSHNMLLSGVDELERLRTEYALGDHVGISGVERMCEKLLRGRRGYRQYRRAKILESSAPRADGGDVHLTIDIELQRILTGYIPAGRNGSIVVLSLPEMQVLAMVSVPVYDLNRYRDRDYYRSLIFDESNRPLSHRAVAGLYPPGSTMKPLAAIAALSEGKINPLTTHTCYGSMFPGGRGPKCWIWPRGSHGQVDVVAAIMNSCNVFFYHVGEDMGIPALAGWMRRFGLGEPTGTGLGEEASPQLPERGTRGESRFLAIGQGGIAVTPMHVARAFGALATGELRSPQLVLEGGQAQLRQPIAGVTDETWKLVREGLDRVVNDPNSQTARNYFHGRLSFNGQPAAELDLRVCGKTGTAQTPRSERTEDGQWRRLEENTLWFACYAPRDKPQVAVVVMLERMEGGSDGAGGGGKNCAPIARETLRLCQAMGYVR